MPPKYLFIYHIIYQTVSDVNIADGKYRKKK